MQNMPHRYFIKVAEWWARFLPAEEGITLTGAQQLGSGSVPEEWREYLEKIIDRRNFRSSGSMATYHVNRFIYYLARELERNRSTRFGILRPSRILCKW